MVDKIVLENCKRRMTNSTEKLQEKNDKLGFCLDRL